MDNPTTPNPSSVAPAEKNNWWLWGLVALVVMAGVAYGLYYYGFIPQGAQRSSPESVSAPEDFSDISAGLDAVDLNSLDSELADIEKELK